jgi:hypothetical protein
MHGVERARGGIVLQVSETPEEVVFEYCVDLGREYHLYRLRQCGDGAIETVNYSCRVCLVARVLMMCMPQACVLASCCVLFVPRLLWALEALRHTRFY